MTIILWLACGWPPHPSASICLIHRPPRHPHPFLPSFLPPFPPRATINRYGFNSLGADAVEENLQVRYLIQQPPLTPYTHMCVASGVAALAPGYYAHLQVFLLKAKAEPEIKRGGPWVDPSPAEPGPISRALLPTLLCEVPHSLCSPLPLALSQVACLASTLARTS